MIRTRIMPPAHWQPIYWAEFETQQCQSILSLSYENTSTPYRTCCTVEFQCFDQISQQIHKNVEH